MDMKLIITESQLNSIKEHELSKQQYLQHYFSAPAEEETVTEFQGISTGFDVNKLKAINSFAGRVKYCKENLKPININGGSSRSVFALGNDKVVKLAKNEKGIAQNRVEGDWSLQNYSVIPKLYETDDYDLYNIMELAKLVKTPKRFTELTGVLWEDVSKYFSNDRNGYEYIDFLNKKYVNDEHENEFVMELHDLLQSYDIAQGDMKKLTSYGEVLRENHPQLVIIDFGLTNYNWREYYS